MRRPDIIKYDCLLIKESFNRTKGLVIPHWRASAAVLFVIAVGVNFLMFGSEGAVAEFTWALSGVVAVVIFGAAVFTWNYVTAPFVLWRRQTDDISALRTELDALEEEKIPGFEICYEPYEPWLGILRDAYYEPGVSEERGPAVFYRFEVRNPKPNTIALGCRPKLIDVEKRNDNDRWESRFGDTLALRWAASQGQEYEAKDITGSDRFFVDVISVDPHFNKVDLKDRQKLLIYQNLFKDPGIYRLTVTVSGNDGLEVREKFILEWTGEWNKVTFLKEQSWLEANT
jgi:hypothetical protein